MNLPCILIVDDQPYNFDVIEALLSNQLYNLHYVSSGSEAIDSLDLFQPDVILLDVMMPELDGIEVCHRIKAMPQWKAVPIIMVTALDAKEDLALCIKAGADDFISKPVNGVELRSRVHSMLRIKQQFDRLQISLERQAILEAEKVELLESRNTELEKQVEFRTYELKAKAEQEQLVAKIASQIRSSLNLQDILETTVQEVRSILNCHSVAIWQFQVDKMMILAKSTNGGSLSCLGQQIHDTFFIPNRIASYCNGQIQVVSDVQKMEMSDCHLKLLEDLQIRAKILVPIIQDETFWGLLNATERDAPRQWKTEEVSLLQQLAIHLAIAIGQATAYQQLQTELIERQKVEAHLRESEQRYATLTAAAPVGIFRTDIEGNYLYVNQRWCSITGLSREEASGMGWLSRVYPDDQERIVNEWHLAFKENRPFCLEYRFQQADGVIVWVFGQIMAERNATGQIVDYVGTITDISELKRAQELIIYNAAYDSLTDLPNRNFLLERLESAIKRTKISKNYRYAVLFLDLDRFKVINDSLGHLAGDKLLKSIALKLKTYLREIDLVARLGGDEFVILLEDISGLEEAITVSDLIIKGFQAPLMLNEYEMFVGTSIGIVLGTDNYGQASHLLRDADIAMYRAKEQGGNCYKIFDAQMHAQAVNRLTLETDLRKALVEKEFIVYYQPVIDIVRDRLIGFESLIRWQHPTHGLVPPLKFIPIAEEIGLIVQIDNWMFLLACQQIVSWKSKFADRFPLKISINLSAQDLRNGSLIEDIDQILIKTGLDGENITLEITESMLIENISKTIEVLTELKERKISISIDDFGTGYSSLNYLHRLPADNLKIDRSFVSGMQQGNRNYKVVNTIISLSNQLGLAVVAEGIETKQQLQWLRELGCEFGQGYLFSKPLTAEEIERQFLHY